MKSIVLSHQLSQLFVTGFIIASCTSPRSKSEECSILQDAAFTGTPLNVIRLRDETMVVGDYAFGDSCILNGPSITYHRNGYIHQLMLYDHDMLIGPLYEFSDNGSVVALDYFEEGVIHGISRRYAPNGRLTLLCHYNRGEKVRCDSVRY